MQGLLTDGSRPRGIGRYTAQLIRAMAQQRGEHELRLMLNANFPGACRTAASQFGGVLPRQAFSSYTTPRSERHHAPPTSPRRRVADAVVRRHVAGLRPDALLFTSLFEMAPKDFSPLDLRRYPAQITAAIVYDLIPAVFDELYLGDRAVRANFFTVMDVLKTADLLLAISDSARQDAIAWLDLDPARIVNVSAAADDRFRSLGLSDQEKASVAQGVGLSRPFVMYVSGADPRKNLRGAVAAFAALPPDVRSRHQLLLVSRLSEEEEALFHQHALELGMEPDGLVLAGGLSDDELVRLFNACRAFIFPSLYEGFGLPVLEAMRCGAPVLAASNSSIPEIVNRGDILFDAASTPSAAHALHRVLTDEALRRDLADWGVRRAGHFTWERSARVALDALDAAAAVRTTARPHVAPCELLDLDGARAELVDALAAAPECDDCIEEFVDALIQSVPAFHAGASRRLLIDVTDTSQSGAWTGIQRVVRQLTASLYDRNAESAVVPVAIELGTDGPVSVPDFVAKTLGHPQDAASYPVRVRAGDDLFMLDSNWIRYPDYAPLFEQVGEHGGRVVTCVYDLIPELHPELCLVGIPAVHERWLRTAVAASDALLCISRSVADELIAYIRRNGLPHRRGLKVGWFHCGSDILRADVRQQPQATTLQSFADGRPTFLMVGTLEPRKNHALALDAFERLWARDADAGLCIVGRRGWNVEGLERRILSHPEIGHRLHWLSDASDADLVHAYGHAEAILCPSAAEGFGLPVAEAARMGRSVICSDIPVFREIGGEGAVYVPLGSPKALAAVVEAWLSGERQADPALISRVSWADAAARVHQVIYGNDWYATL